MMDQTPTGPGWYWGQYEGGRPICIEVDWVDGNKITFGPNSESASRPGEMLYWLGKVVDIPLLIVPDDVELRAPTTEELEECVAGVEEANERLAQLEAEEALAFFGARVVYDYHRGDQGFMSVCGDSLDRDAEEAKVMNGLNFDLLPGIEDAMARLLDGCETHTHHGMAAYARRVLEAHDAANEGEPA